MGRLVAIAVVALCAGGAGAGCVSVGTAHHGNAIAWSGVAALEPGRTTMAETLQALGAPDVMQRHPDGMMLLWRQRRHDYTRLGIEPDRLVSFVPTNRALAAVLSNLSLVIEDAVESEDRVAVLLDDDAVVQGVGVHRGIAR